MKKTMFALLTGAIALALSASAFAQFTLSGTALSGLTYRGNGGTAQYVPASGSTPDLASLSTPDSGLIDDAPVVYVRAGNLGQSSLGPLNAFSASYDLYGSTTGPDGAQPYWLTYLYAPNGGYVGVLTMGGPVLDSSSTIHVIYYNATDTGNYWGDTLSTLESLPYEGTTFGQLTVYESGPEIGNWANGNNVIPASANFDSITIVPEPGTVTLVGLGIMSMMFVIRRRKA